MIDFGFLPFSSLSPLTLQLELDPSVGSSVGPFSFRAPSSMEVKIFLVPLLLHQTNDGRDNNFFFLFECCPHFFFLWVVVADELLKYFFAFVALLCDSCVF